MTTKKDYPKHAVKLPEDVMEEFRKLYDTGNAWESIKITLKSLKAMKLRKAAKWIKDNPIKYGNGFYYGFYSNDHPELMVLND